ncbi:hypothetical protein C8R44DRAFT_754256 [Mycena epipterygia]|nr:hypothetical protein C8R44DRAFT_754256 [Mycena epipterygia]
MAPHHADNLAAVIRYTSLAANTAKELAGLFQVPFLGLATTLTFSILKSIESVKGNKKDYIQMAEQIHEILCAIIGIYTTSGSHGIVPLALIKDISKFTQTLQNIYTAMRAQEGLGIIKKLFKQSETTLRLQTCAAELQDSLTQTQFATITEIKSTQSDAEERHARLLQFTEAQSDLTNSNHTSSLTGYQSSLQNRFELA